MNPVYNLHTIVIVDEATVLSSIKFHSGFLDLTISVVSVSDAVFQSDAPCFGGGLHAIASFAVCLNAG